MIHNTSSSFRLGFDARMWGPKHTGIGRYVENLVDQLIILKNQGKLKAEIILFVRKGDLKVMRKKYGNQVFYKLADFSHYSLKEQLFLPKVLRETNCDLVHFPHFNVPLFYQEPFVATIHDLTKHSFGGQKATTRFLPFYYLKYLGYKIIIRQTVKKAAIIFTPSNFVKNQLVSQYKIDPKKIIVTYEGVGEKFTFSRKANKASQREVLTLYRLTKPYLLYVGNLYPHKNIPLLIEAVKRARQKIPSLSLVIVCGRNVFWQRLKQEIKASQSESFVRLTGFVPDEDLKILYQEATAFVFPSLSEGFGLPGLEAASLGCPVVCANTTALPEIYGSAALYFNPHNPQDMAEKIIMICEDEKLRKNLIEKGYQQVKKYSWEKMAEQTIAGYGKAMIRNK
ncbi:glycosyltransferase family 4 protein [Candidatus Shapirobacteria bacterium]|nr:glycosyltransferase family 4 protein [Candidatus Shapirobacteria bacterium]